MDVINSLIWLIVGMTIGWIANRMGTALIARRADSPRFTLADLLGTDKKTGPYSTPILSPLSSGFEDESFKDQYFANDSLGG